MQIIEYLVERYDTKNKLSFPAGSKEAALAKQWLYFQVSSAFIHQIRILYLYSQLHRYLGKVHTTVNPSGLSAITRKSFPAPWSVT